MYAVAGKDMIIVSRGDYALIPLKFTGVENGEAVVFTVSSVIDPAEVLIEKTVVVEEGMAYIALSQEETKTMNTGRYYWDVCIPDFWMEGERHTPVRPRIFQIVGVSHLV